MYKNLIKLIFRGSYAIDEVWAEIHCGYDVDIENKMYLNYKNEIRKEYNKLIIIDKNFDIELEKEILNNKIKEERSKLEDIYSSTLVTLTINIVINVILNNLLSSQLNSEKGDFLISILLILLSTLAIIIYFGRKFDKEVYKDTIKKSYYRLRFKVLEEIEQEKKEYSESLKITSTIKDFINNKATLEDLRELQQLIEEKVISYNASK